MCKIEPFKTGLTCCLIVFAGMAQAATYRVSSASHFNALPALNAGDANVTAAAPGSGGVQRNRR